MQWLIDQSIILSLLVLSLLLLSPMANRLLGANATYKLWGLVPLVLLFNALFSWFNWSFYKQISQLETFKISLYTLAKQQSHLNAAISETFLENDLAFFAWLLIAISLSCYLFHQYLGLNEYVARLAKVDSTNAKLPVLHSEGQHSPFLFGFRKPKIVVPNDFFQNFDHTQQRLILEHEESHFNQGDNFWNLLAVALLIVFWFNPLLWLAFRRFRQQQELACDGVTTSDYDESKRQSYAHALLSAVLNKQNGNDEKLKIGRLALSTSYGEKSQLKDRLLKLRQHRHLSKARWLPTTFAIAAVLLALFIAYSQILHESEPARIAIHQPYPKYPVDAAKDKIEGFVLLQFDITPSGETKRIKVLESQPEAIFDKNAALALSQWRYEATDKATEAQQIRLDFAL